MRNHDDQEDSMKRLWLWAALALIAWPATGLGAQERGTITGTATDAVTQAPLRGVQITLPGTNLGTLTNAQGRFTIGNISSGTHQLRANMIGYAVQEQAIEIVAGGTVSVDLALRQTAVELDALVVNAVTGQAERRRELGTNTGTITSADLERAPITKIADVLTARTPGVTLQGVSGSLGTSQRIRIRGANSLSLSNEPLIYVDGVLFSTAGGGIGIGGQNVTRLNDLNPDDIENVEILKGPAASALYGTAAANGVILITTRRGRAGDTRWRAYVETGTVQDRNRYPSTYLAYQANDPSARLFTASGVLNTSAYRACPNVDAARGLCRQDDVASLNPFTDSRVQPFSTGQRTKVGLSASGGGDALTYFLSADRDDNTGIVAFNTEQRSNLRANFTARLRDDLNVQVTSSYTNSALTLNANDNNIFSPLINGLLMAPYVPTADDLAASRPGQRPSYGFGFMLDDLEHAATTQEIDRFIVGANASYQPLTWLTWNANLGLDYFSGFNHQTVQPGRLPIAATWTPGRRTAIRNASHVYTGNLTGVATHALRPDLVSMTTVGASYSRNLLRNLQCQGVGLVEGARSCGATSSLFFVNEATTEIITVGALARQQLAFNDRVFLSASVRGDDNSAFGADFGFIYYPSVSASWVLSEEPFFPSLGPLSDLRLRTSFGTSGLRPNFRDAVTLLGPVSVSVDGQDASAVTLQMVGNTGLKPERTREYEAGFDAGFFQNRVALDFTYYDKLSRDALIRRQLAPSFGLTGTGGTTGAIFDNLGQIRNSGTELGLNAHVFESRNTALSLRLSATTLSNEIVSLGDGVEPIVFNRGTQRHQEGYPAGAYFQPRYTFEDENGDGRLSPDEVRMIDSDPVFLGTSLPTNTQSVTADLRMLRYLTISTLFERRAGHKQFNMTEEFRCTTGYNRINRGNCAAVADPNASLEEQARFIATRFHDTSAGYIEDASFVKWRELSLTLQTPTQLSRRFRTLDGASLTVSGRNLRTWTDYTGIDPEINETGSQMLVNGGDFMQNEFNTQPAVRSLLVRLNLSF
jgi:TonB-dependent starch-binding outer membrane protein SusC